MSRADPAPVVLDGGDRRCVQLLIELRRLTLTAHAGTLIHLITTDPAAPLGYVGGIRHRL